MAIEEEAEEVHRHRTALGKVLSPRLAETIEEATLADEIASSRIDTLHLPFEMVVLLATLRRNLAQPVHETRLRVAL